MTSPTPDRNNNSLIENELNNKLSASSIEVSLSPPDETENSDADLTIRRNKSFNTINEAKKDADDLDGFELSLAMSRRNSFISYFDDQYNVPDHTFDNLKVAVDYIVESIEHRK